MYPVKFCEITAALFNVATVPIVVTSPVKFTLVTVLAVKFATGVVE